MGKKKGKSGGKEGEQGKSAAGATTQPSSAPPSTSAAAPQSTPTPQQQPQQQPQEQHQGGGGDSWQTAGKAGSGGQQQGYQGQAEGGGGGQYAQRGGQGGGRGGQQQPYEGQRGGYRGHGDGQHSGGRGGGRGGQQYSGQGRGSPTPSQGSSGSDAPLHGQGRGERGGGRGRGWGADRGAGAGYQQQRQQKPSSGPQQFPGLGQPPSMQYQERPPQQQGPPPGIGAQQFPGFGQPQHAQQRPPQQQGPPPGKGAQSMQQHTQQRSSQSTEEVGQQFAQVQLQEPRQPVAQQQQQQIKPQQQQRQQVGAPPPRSAPGFVASATIVPEDETPANFRKGGTKGKKIQVLANHFQIKLSQKMSKAYQYDVALDPDKPKKLLPVVMEQFQRNYYPKNFPAFDGMKNLFSARELPLQLPFTGAIKIMEDDREKEYKVKIQFAREVDLSALAKFFNQTGENHMVPPMHVLQCLDVVLRSRPSTSMITAGRSYFSVPERVVVLGNGMEMYRGFYQSAILGWKPFLNVDVSHKAFPSRMPILDLIFELDNRTDLKAELQRNTADKLAKFLYNLKVEYQIPNHPASKRSYRVNGLDQPSNYFKFKNDEGVEMTVAAYFQNIKRYKLQYPHLPSLWVGSKQRKPKMVLPCELCVVLEGQVTNRKMDDIQTRNMIREAATNTTVRKDNIMRSMKLANHNSSPSMQEFGLAVDSNMTAVTARVLQPPAIRYQNAQRMQMVAKGVWRSGIFYKASEIKNWAIVCLDDKIYEKDLYSMKDLFVKQGQSCGMNISSDIKPTKLKLPYTGGQKVIYNYFEQCKRSATQLVVVVLLDFNKLCYSWVKKAAELQTGCLTQCIKSNTMRRMNTQTVDNILLKVNAKLNGVNHVLGDKPLALSRPVMIMGADVTHPSPESRDCTPSVAAVTASHDPLAFRYNIVWRLQDPRAEIITDLEKITREQLMFFFKKTDCKPERIIFYRDGVSDGQFAAVRRQEIQAMRNACSSLNPDYKPAITFLVVQKRHHTRLFPCDPRVSEDRNGNVPAGTCVDTQITHPTAQDFYLVSHASIQGVAKPTKYRTIWDDSDFTDDDIEQLTYYLCHMFARCNRSVSYPAPTYYAHLAAARAKVYIEEERLDMRNLATEHERKPIMEVIQKEHPMFFV